MGLKCFSNTAIFKDHVFAKRLSKKKIVCTSDQKMRTHEQNSKIAFVIDLYKLRKFFGKKYRGRKKNAIYGN